jgi:hypothetical protein
MNSGVIFDFNTGASLDSWYVVDDVVMGGRSSGSLTINEEGHGVFSGSISLENNGGFSSLRHSLNEMNVAGASNILLKIKGDGKKYQLRIKHDRSSYYSYISWFETSGEWEEINIPLKDMYPSFRGRTLDMPDFDHESIQEIGLLIGNKKAEDFRLLIDRIELR